MELTISRLKLRSWKDSDLAAFARMNGDPRVMEYYPRLLSRNESDALAGKIREDLNRNGYGLWALEAPGLSDFVGYTGLSRPDWEAAFTPCVEIGWRLDAQVWGRGYAPEAARRVLDFAFGELALTEVLSFTARVNQRSIRVMEKIGMRKDARGDFDHPRLAPGHPLRPHVLYRAGQP